MFVKISCPLERPCIPLQVRGSYIYSLNVTFRRSLDYYSHVRTIETEVKKENLTISSCTRM